MSEREEHGLNPWARWCTWAGRQPWLYERRRRPSWWSAVRSTAVLLVVAAAASLLVSPWWWGALAGALTVVVLAMAEAFTADLVHQRKARHAVTPQARHDALAGAARVMWWCGRLWPAAAGFSVIVIGAGLSDHSIWWLLAGLLLASVIWWPSVLGLTRWGVSRMLETETVPTLRDRQRIEHTRQQHEDGRAVEQARCAPVGVLGARSVASQRERWARPDRATVPGWIAGDTWVLPETPGAVRAVMLGASGCGKTVVLSNIVEDAAARGWDVVMIDAKGDPADAEALRARIGAPGQMPFDALAGDSPAEQVESLMRVWPQSGTDSDFYRSRFAAVLSAVIDSETGRQHRARSLDEVAERLAYPDRWMDRSTGALLGDPKVTDAARIEWMQRVQPVAPYLGAEGWSWGHRPPRLVHSIQPSDEHQRAVGRMILAALFVYLRKRQERGDTSPLLVVIDEFAQLADARETPAEIAARLFELARSSNVGVIVAGQSVETVGATEQEQDRLLTVADTVILGRLAAPERAVMLAGTRQRMETTYDAYEGGAVSGRAQEAFIVPPQAVRELPRGAFYVIGHGAANRVIGAPPNRVNPNSVRDNPGDTP